MKVNRERLLESFYRAGYEVGLHSKQDCRHYGCEEYKLGHVHGRADRDVGNPSYILVFFDEIRPHYLPGDVIIRKYVTLKHWCVLSRLAHRNEYYVVIAENVDGISGFQIVW